MCTWLSKLPIRKWIKQNLVIMLTMKEAFWGWRFSYIENNDKMPCRAQLDMIRVEPWWLRASMDTPSKLDTTLNNWQDIKTWLESKWPFMAQNSRMVLFKTPKINPSHSMGHDTISKRSTHFHLFIIQTSLIVSGTFFTLIPKSQPPKSTLVYLSLYNTM